MTKKTDSDREQTQEQKMIVDLLKRNDQLMAELVCMSKEKRQLLDALDAQNIHLNS